MRYTGAAAFLLLLFGMAVLPATHASAHAALVRAEPSENSFLQQAPQEVVLTFTETLDSAQSTIRVLNASGQPLALGPSTVSGSGLVLRVALPRLGPGIYNVLWVNVSTVDGHALRGSYPFTVLNADGTLPEEVNTVQGLRNDRDPPPEADGIAVRWLSLLGLALAGGVPVILLLAGAQLAAVRRPLVLLMLTGASLLLVAALLQVPLLRDTYPGRGLNEIARETRAGSYWLVRLGALIVLAVCALSLAESFRLAAWSAVAGTLVYLWSFTATSHAAAGSGSNWAMAIDLVHGASAVAWIGAVLGLLVVTRSSTRNAARLLPRFGVAASMAVFLLLSTGLFNSFVEVDRFDRLWETRYGLTLLTKLGLMVPLLGIALFNARRARRLMETGAAGRRTLMRTAYAEAVAGVLVFAAAAALTQTFVAKSIFERPPDRPFDGTSLVSDLPIRFQVSPNRTGLNTYTATLPARVTADRLRLTFRYQEDQSVGPQTLVLAPTSTPGVYSRQGPFMTLEGRWRIEVEVRRPNEDDVRAFFDVRPAGSAAATVRRGGEWDNPAPGMSWNEFGGFAVLALALFVAVFRRYGTRFRQPFGLASSGASVLGFGVGFLLLFGVHGHQPIQGLPANPTFPDDNSIQKGREIYQRNCAACHGTAGVPPKGLKLEPYPLDLTVHVPQHPDGQIFVFIREGLEGTAMRAWGRGDNRLSDEQIWDVVNYLRTLGGVTE